MDTVGSSRLCAEIGQDRFDLLMAEQYTVLRRIVQLTGGSGSHSAGDGLMAWFPSAVTALEVAQRMHHEIAALSARRDAAPLCVRIVVALSDVRIIDGELRGVAPVIAARLEKSVGAGETVCTEAVRVAAIGRGAFSFHRLGARDLGGVPEPVVVWRVGPAETPPAPLPQWSDRGSEVDDIWGSDR